MKTSKSSWFLIGSAIALALSAAAYAQTTGASSSGGQSGQPGQSDSSGQKRPAMRGPHALGPFSIFDTNHDGVISADEIANASKVLSSLDKNGDGKLTPDEIRSALPRPPRPPRDDDASGDDRKGPPSGGDMPPPPPSDQ